jgi:hypothetical protein
VSATRTSLDLRPTATGSPDIATPRRSDQRPARSSIKPRFIGVTTTLGYIGFAFVGAAVVSTIV